MICLCYQVIINNVLQSYHQSRCEEYRGEHASFLVPEIRQELSRSGCLEADAHIVGKEPLDTKSKLQAQLDILPSDNRSKIVVILAVDLK